MTQIIDYNKLVIDSLGNIYVAGLGQGRYIVTKYDQKTETGFG